MFNSSSKSEVIGGAAMARVCIYHHLPRGFKYCVRPWSLPVLDIESSIHRGESPETFHDKTRADFFR